MRVEVIARLRLVESMTISAKMCDKKAYIFGSFAREYIYATQKICGMDRSDVDDTDWINVSEHFGAVPSDIDMFINQKTNEDFDIHTLLKTMCGSDIILKNASQQEDDEYDGSFARHKVCVAVRIKVPPLHSITDANEYEFEPKQDDTKPHIYVNVNVDVLVGSFNIFKHTVRDFDVNCLYIKNMNGRFKVFDIKGVRDHLDKRTFIKSYIDKSIVENIVARRCNCVVPYAHLAADAVADAVATGRTKRLMARICKMIAQGYVINNVPLFELSEPGLYNEEVCPICHKKRQSRVVQLSCCSNTVACAKCAIKRQDEVIKSMENMVLEPKNDDNAVADPNVYVKCSDFINCGAISLLIN